MSSGQLFADTLLSRSTCWPTESYEAWAQLTGRASCPQLGTQEKQLKTCLEANEAIVRWAAGVDAHILTLLEVRSLERFGKRLSAAELRANFHQQLDARHHLLWLPAWDDVHRPLLHDQRPRCKRRLGDAQDQ